MRRWLSKFQSSLFLGQTALPSADCIELYALVGQSNAMGWKGKESEYPPDIHGIDASIPFFYYTPGITSAREWTTLRAQAGHHAFIPSGCSAFFSQ